MDAVTLLRRAQEVGLRVEPIGDKLLVRGPKRAGAWSKFLPSTRRKCWRRLSRPSCRRRKLVARALRAASAGPMVRR